MCGHFPFGKGCFPFGKGCFDVDLGRGRPREHQGVARERGPGLLVPCGDHTLSDSVKVLQLTRWGVDAVIEGRVDGLTGIARSCEGVYLTEAEWIAIA